MSERFYHCAFHRMLIADLYRSRKTTSEVVISCACLCLRPREWRLDIYPLMIGAMYFNTTDRDKCVCSECQSMNCVTHQFEDAYHVSDCYGECLDCGSFNVVFEGSPAWDELVRAGVCV